jgi:hypothetical protein
LHPGSEGRDGYGRKRKAVAPLGSTEKCKMKEMRGLRTIAEEHKPVSQSVGKL